MDWKIRGRALSCQRTLIMAVLNVTPDSFSDGGRYFDPAAAAAQALELEKKGADILDVGAESTRPGAEDISEEEELRRLLPVLEAILERISIPVSIDTTKAKVARVCLEKGAHIINDVSGLGISGSDMAAAVNDFQAGFVLMHRRGSAKTMQQMTQYADVTEDVLSELEASLKKAFQWNLKPEQIAVDPGFGFSKTAEQNLDLLKNFEKFKRFNLPVLAGVSRKSFLGQLTGKPPLDRDWASAVASAFAVQKGASIIRVHEVIEIRDAVRVAEALR